MSICQNILIIYKKTAGEEDIITRERLELSTRERYVDNQLSRVSGGKYTAGRFFRPLAGAVTSASGRRFAPLVGKTARP